LKLLARLTVGDILLRVRTAVLIEIVPELDHLLSGVEASSATRDKRLRALALQVKPLKVVWGDAEIMGDLGHRKTAKRLLRVRREFLQPELIELARDLRSLS
jgi:hypothetical protein